MDSFISEPQGHFLKCNPLAVEPHSQEMVMPKLVIHALATSFENQGETTLVIEPSCLDHGLERPFYYSEADFHAIYLVDHS